LHKSLQEQIISNVPYDELIGFSVLCKFLSMLKCLKWDRSWVMIEFMMKRKGNQNAIIFLISKHIDVGFQEIFNSKLNIMYFTEHVCELGYNIL